LGEPKIQTIAKRCLEQVAWNNLIMKLLIIDTETTGLDVERHRTIEVAAILYSVPHRTTLFQLSTLLNANDNAAAHINRIPPAVLPEVCPKTQQHFIDLLQHLAHSANYAIAHNAAFDRQWFDGHHLPILSTSAGKPLEWLCTLEDFSFPYQTRQARKSSEPSSQSWHWSQFGSSCVN
jgi:DNA polymerase III subunit epsilon